MSMGTIAGILASSILAGGISDGQGTETPVERRYGWTQERVVRGDALPSKDAGKAKSRFVLKEDLLPDSSPNGGNQTLFSRDEATGDERKLAEGVDGARLSPDGRLFYVQRGVLFSLDEKGASLRLADRCTGDMSFDRKGASVAIVRPGKGDDPTVLDILDRDGSKAATLADLGDAVVWLPVFTPDGKAVIFLSGESGIASFWRVDIDGLANGKRDGFKRRQLTNRDVTPQNGGVLSQDFVPPAEARDSMSFASPSELEYAAGDGSVWRLDVVTGKASKISGR